jgi:hypothetical protein
MNSQIKHIAALFVVVTGGFLCQQSALAAKPAEVTVTAASPSSALQGTALDVVISGTGFGKGSTVRFLLMGTDDDSHVEIVGNITYDKESGELTAPIYVLGEAKVDGYDIEVTATSGRRGNGTDLFSVEKNNGTKGEQGTTECSDGIDNDGDGKIDGEDDDCFGSNKPNRDGSGRGKDLPLVATLDPHPRGNSLQHEDPLVDVGEPYVHGDKHVKALAGDPRLRRIEVQTGGGGKNIREVRVNLLCTAIPESSVGAGDGIDNCAAIETDPDGIYDDTGGHIFSVIPYLVNCPNNTPPDTSPCHDVFTMGTGAGGAQLMSFKLYSGVGPTIEAAFKIGGSSIVDPGNCLALLTDLQRTAFLSEHCVDPADCNVTVTAEDKDGDGENDDWMIDGVGIKALICSVGTQSNVVYGQTILDIGYHARKK